LKSKVLSKVVLVTEKDDLCSCDKEFSKICVVRIAGNLPCQESIVRLTPVDRTLDEPDGDLSISDGDPEIQIRKIKSEFLKTIQHLDRMK